MPRDYTDEEKTIILRDWDTLTPENRTKAQARGITPPATQAPASVPRPATSARVPAPHLPAPPVSPKPQPPNQPRAAMPAPTTVPSPQQPEGLVAWGAKDLKDAGIEYPDATTPLGRQDLLRTAAAFGINVAGTAAGGLVGALGGPFAGATIPLGAMAGSMGARELNKYLGLEEPGLGGDILAGAAPWLGSGGKGTKDLLKTGMRYGRAGKALRTADEETATALASTVAKNTERQALYDQRLHAQTARIAARDAQRQALYIQRVHDTRTAAARKTQAAERAYVRRQSDAYTAALEEAKDAQADYRQATQDYRDIVAAQQTAVTTAQGLPQTFAPPIPARRLYQQFAETFGGASVDLAPAKRMAAVVKDQLGEHLPTMQPSQLQKLTADIQQLTPEHATVADVHQYLKDVGPLTRSSDGQTRRVARQLFSGLSDTMATAPGASGALGEASAAARRQFAVEDLERIVRRAVSIGNDGHPRLASGRIATTVARLEAEDPLFRGSFIQRDWERLTRNVEALAGTPAIPSRQPTPPPPPSFPPAPTGYPPEPTLPPTLRPPAALVPATIPPPRLTPTPPPANPMDYLKPPQWGRLLLEGGLAVYTGHPKLAAGIVAADAVSYGVARLLLQPYMQPTLRRMMQPSGHIDPRMLALFTAAIQLPAQFGGAPDQAAGTPPAGQPATTPGPAAARPPEGAPK